MPCPSQSSRFNHPDYISLPTTKIKRNTKELWYCGPTHLYCMENNSYLLLAPSWQLQEFLWMQCMQCTLANYICMSSNALGRGLRMLLADTKIIDNKGRVMLGWTQKMTFSPLPRHYVCKFWYIGSRQQISRIPLCVREWICILGVFVYWNTRTSPR